jgi:hypothetical protein
MSVLPDELKKYISYVVDVPFEDEDLFKTKIPSLRFHPSLRWNRRDGIFHLLHYRTKFYYLDGV